MWIISTGNALTKRLSGLLLGLISWCQTKEFRYIDYSAVCYLKTPFFMLSLAWKFFTSKTFETFSFERIHKCFSYSVGNQEFFFFFHRLTSIPYYTTVLQVDSQKSQTIPMLCQVIFFLLQHMNPIQIYCMLSVPTNQANPTNSFLSLNTQHN